ncbi:MAG TPA: nickel-dependent lactate racemase [Desulfitobacterium dehalogenans]|uniref:Nickel-dependent lactate racemase n=1 Tax=Desulfitobacterium dehalogenans TaxID=36854 RepID=A0A7C6Z453_9FIRM|nr:nickel-dependent lactate racemase [Desulfitobacterium dehalogenans]
MKKEYRFKYGEGYQEFLLNPQNVIQELQAKDIQPLEDVVKEIKRVLDTPIASPPFNTLFKAGDQVTIVVSDITRLVKLHEYLPTIVNRLNTLGIPDKDILILTATGTHRGQTPEEKKKIVGEEVYSRIEVVDHDCDHSEMVHVGTTPRGTEVVVNRFVVDRKVILTGGIVHHLMAGFGGGRKSILPGVASRKTIAQNHLHSLDPHAEQSNPLIGVGALIDNPLHEDMVDATRFVNPEFLINTIIHTDGRIAKFVAGHWLKAWEEGCTWADENYGVPIEKKADLVIASCGGFPKDISLYQSTKTLFNAALAVKPGGTILILAECREGAGADEFFGWNEPLKEKALDPELRKNFTIPGYIFYAAVESARKAKVILYSEIEPELVKPMGMIGANSFEEAIQLAQINQEKQDVILMPYGGATIPLYQKGK